MREIVDLPILPFCSPEIARINERQCQNYSGHGSPTGWRGNLLTATEARGLISESYAIFILMNCLNGYFQDANLDSLGEALMKAERGGALAVWASSGLTLPMEQTLMNQALYGELFNPSLAGKAGITLGEATRQAKTKINDRDIRRTWILFGDPTLKVR
ncbi:MAG: C25 family cysteine peptidase [Acidobacteriota bacterium]